MWKWCQVTELLTCQCVEVVSSNTSPSACGSGLLISTHLCCPGEGGAEAGGGAAEEEEEEAGPQQASS